MPDLLVDTAKIEKNAQELRIINKSIDDRYQSTINAVNKYLNDWEGQGATAATTLFSKNNETLRSNRFLDVDNYVIALVDLIDAGYVEVEDTNTKLAELFK